MIDCKFLGQCGSCTLLMPYDEQLKFKHDFIKVEFGEFFMGEFELFSSSPSHYRSRAEFGIWHNENNISYTMNSKSGGKILIDECLKVDAKITNLMQPLLNAISKKYELNYKLFGIEFISTTKNLLAVLLYHKNISELKSLFDELANELNISIIARSRGIKLVCKDELFTDELNINGKKFKYVFSDVAFVQPNKGVNEKMIDWAVGCVESGEDLMELYCGHGNFTLPLSFKFKNVIATEISKSSIINAIKNCELNSVCNIKFLRMDADELMSAFKKEREFNRLKNVNLDDFNFTHILVDPPRAGLSDSVMDFIKNYENIIYISCNPTTLKQNLTNLCKTHKVVKFAIFDQFANTNHIECGVLLKAKNER